MARVARFRGWDAPARRGRLLLSRGKRPEARRPARRAHGFGRSHDFCLDPRGRVTRDSGQPVIYAGVALLRRSLLEAVAERRFSLYPLFIDALDGGRLAGVVLDAEWFHVGDPAALAEAERAMAAAVA